MLFQFFEEHGVALKLSSLAVLWAAGAVQSAGADAAVVYRAPLENQAITPVTSRFISRALQSAEAANARACVLVLDTPGGLLDSTREVTKVIIESKVPVVVYVAPSGGRAASAGLFITLAAHVAAMAPGTNIGAAYPVQIGGAPTPDKEQKEAAKTPMENKVVNDTVAWARSLAELRGRNAEWVSKAVTEAASASATEALASGVIDIVAVDFDELLSKLNGRTVALSQRELKLDLAAASVRDFRMWWGERVLAALAHPNLAFLLLILGFYGIVLEFYTPGWGVAGTIGVICVVLALFSMAMLPINYVGLMLLGIGLALLVAEAFVTSYGALTVGGVLCLVAGALMLVDEPEGFLRISLWTALPVALATAAITGFLVSRVIRTHRAPVATGRHGLTGASAIAREDFRANRSQYSGYVYVHGELWRAVSTEPVTAGAALRVEESHGLELTVKGEHHV